ncbi:hypothetical protein CDD83_1659 [Cordyceps sp. RAO-2017]|nr:hypothetical protein CDD83_1659 [Cordyceps sp. RAO-2017]
MHLILTGATGLVGSAVLDAMLRAKDVSKISIVSRRPVRMAEERADPRVDVVLHRDFASWDAALLERLRGADGCVWALGISQTKVGADEYVRITRDYALAAARAMAGLRSPSPDSPAPPSDSSGSGTPFRFVYVSGEGATQTPGRFSAIFARTKGETETALGDGLAGTYSVRPAFVDAAAHAAIRPYIPDPGLIYGVGLAALAPAIRCAARGMHSPTEPLGDFLTQLAMGRMDGALDGQGAFRLGSSWVVENAGFRRMMGL